MATSVTPLRNVRKMLVMDMRGVEVEVRDYINTPYTHFFNDDPVCIIDWIAADGNRPNDEEVCMPVKYNGPTLSALKGIEFSGDYAWGSSVKTGHTFGLVRDIGKDTGMFQFVEDGQRWQRWMMAQGIWGGVEVSGMRIGIIRPGQVFEGIGPVEDGFGYVRRDIVDKGYNDLPKIKMGKAKGSYTMWQRVRPWSPELAAELTPKIYSRLESYVDLKDQLFDQYSSWDEKKAYYELDKDMIFHPYVANALNRSRGELFARAATTVPLGGKMYLAVPTICKKFASEWICSGKCPFCPLTTNQVIGKARFP